MQQAISYRDPSGFVIIEDQVVKRFVSHSYANEYDLLMRSGLYRKLVGEKLLIPHTEAELSLAEQHRYHRVLLPELVPFISLPYEWSYHQWKEAVITLLRINTIAIGYGMILKDATPFNFSFHNGHCVLIDTLSFEQYHERQPWIAYRQFCETMLGPLALMKYNDADWGKIQRVSISGWNLPFISRHLPWRSYFKLAILVHIHWHGTYNKMQHNKAAGKTTFNREKLLMLWQMMERSVSKWQLPSRSGVWAGYYEHGIETEAYLHDKVQVITSWLQNSHPGRVIDLGTNNGKFSLIASLYAKEVIAVDADHACIDALQQVIRQKNITNTSTAIADLTQPTPGLGWNNKERASLLSRLQGDMLLALALVHHLCITGQVPLSFIAQLFAGITSRYAIVEFVPPSDPKVITMLRNRNNPFDDYTETNFVYCFSEHFMLVAEHNCEASARKLFLWEKKYGES